MRRQIQIVTMACPRCGRQVAGVSRSIYGADDAHAKYSGLCQRCVTNAERDAIERAQATAIQEYRR